MIEEFRTALSDVAPELVFANHQRGLRLTLAILQKQARQEKRRRMMEVTGGMSPELWAILDVGVAVVGLHWRTAGMVNDLSRRIDALYVKIASIKERLTAVETTLSLLLKGLHIEVSGERQRPWRVNGLTPWQVEIHALANFRLTGFNARH